MKVSCTGCASFNGGVYRSVQLDSTSETIPLTFEPAVGVEDSTPVTWTAQFLLIEPDPLDISDAPFDTATDLISGSATINLRADTVVAPSTLTVPADDDDDGFLTFTEQTDHAGQGNEDELEIAYTINEGDPTYARLDLADNPLFTSSISRPLDHLTATGTEKFSIANVGQGTHYARIIVDDSLGHPTDETRMEFTIDTIVDTATLELPTMGSDSIVGPDEFLSDSSGLYVPVRMSAQDLAMGLASAQLTITGGDLDPSEVHDLVIPADPTDLLETTYHFERTTAQGGTYTFTFTATDLGGATKTQEFGAITLAPSGSGASGDVDLLAFADDLFVQTGTDITFSAVIRDPNTGDALPDVEVELSEAGTSIQTVSTDADGLATFAVSSDVVAETTFTLTAVGTTGGDVFVNAPTLDLVAQWARIIVNDFADAPDSLVGVDTTSTFSLIWEGGDAVEDAENDITFSQVVSTANGADPLLGSSPVVLTVAADSGTPGTYSLHAATPSKPTTVEVTLDTALAAFSNGANDPASVFTISAGNTDTVATFRWLAAVATATPDATFLNDDDAVTVDLDLDWTSNHPSGADDGTDYERVPIQGASADVYVREVVGTTSTWNLLETLVPGDSDADGRTTFDIDPTDAALGLTVPGSHDFLILPSGHSPAGGDAHVSDPSTDQPYGATFSVLWTSVDIAYVDDSVDGTTLRDLFDPAPPSGNPADGDESAADRWWIQAKDGSDEVTLELRATYTHDGLGLPDGSVIGMFLDGDTTPVRTAPVTSSQSTFTCQLSGCVQFVLDPELSGSDALLRHSVHDVTFGVVSGLEPDGDQIITKTTETFSKELLWTSLVMDVAAASDLHNLGDPVDLEFTAHWGHDLGAVATTPRTSTMTLTKSTVAPDATTTTSTFAVSLGDLQHTFSFTGPSNIDEAGWHHMSPAIIDPPHGIVPENGTLDMDHLWSAIQLDLEGNELIALPGDSIEFTSHAYWAHANDAAGEPMSLADRSLDGVHFDVKLDGVKANLVPYSTSGTVSTFSNLEGVKQIIATGPDHEVVDGMGNAKSIDVRDSATRSRAWVAMDVVGTEGGDLLADSYSIVGEDVEMRFQATVTGAPLATVTDDFVYSFATTDTSRLSNIDAQPRSYSGRPLPNPQDAFSLVAVSLDENDAEVITPVEAAFTYSDVDETWSATVASADLETVGTYNLRLKSALQIDDAGLMVLQDQEAQQVVRTNVVLAFKEATSTGGTMPNHSSQTLWSNDDSEVKYIVEATWGHDGSVASNLAVDLVDPEDGTVLETATEGLFGTYEFTINPQQADAFDRFVVVTQATTPQATTLDYSDETLGNALTVFEGMDHMNQSFVFTHLQYEVMAGAEVANVGQGLPVTVSATWAHNGSAVLEAARWVVTVDEEESPLITTFHPGAGTSSGTTNVFAYDVYYGDLVVEYDSSVQPPMGIDTDAELIGGLPAASWTQLEPTLLVPTGYKRGVEPPEVQVRSAGTYEDPTETENFDVWPAITTKVHQPVDLTYRIGGNGPTQANGATMKLGSSTLTYQESQTAVNYLRFTEGWVKVTARGLSHTVQGVTITASDVDSAYIGFETGGTI